MLTVSLGRPFLIAPSVLSNVYSLYIRLCLSAMLDKCIITAFDVDVIHYKLYQS